MSLAGFWIIGGGITVTALFFVFAAFNMGSAFDDPDIKGIFKAHIGAMIGMAIGGLIVALGAIFAIIDAIKAYG